MACCMYGFSRDAQLQATVNTSCWHKAFVLYMMCWKSPMAASHSRTLSKTLCSGEELNVSARQLNFCYISIKECLKVNLELRIHC
jgi:hypothetical protein